VIAPDVGGGFGAKGGLYDDELVVVAVALRLGRRVIALAGAPEVEGALRAATPAEAVALARRYGEPLRVRHEIVGG